MNLLKTASFLLILSFNFLFSNPEITRDEIYKHIDFLASDKLEGRKPGTPGGKAAAEYIRNYFKKLDLKLLGDDGFQYLDVITKVEAGPGNKLEFNNFSGKPEVDFIPLPFSENKALKAPLVFAGYGFDIKDKGAEWNSYANIDVKGKWVLVLRNNPDLHKRSSPFDFYSSLRQKAVTARDKGAGGILLVSGPKAAPEDKLYRLNVDESRSVVGIPVLNITRETADRLLKGKGLTIAVLEDSIMITRKPLTFDMGVLLDAAADVKREMAKTQNVIAVLPGNDSVLKNEYVVLGAHYDHLGYGGPGSGSRMPDIIAIHNGADDNASGVAALLEAAEKFAAEKNNKRSIIFVSFTAEEMGLLGSKYFTAHPPVKLDNIKFMLNIDMVGRIDSVKKVFIIGGTGTGGGLPEIIDKYASNSGYTIRKSESGFGPSDQASFYADSIPVLNFYGIGHMDYHTPFDDIDKINTEGIRYVADLAYDILSNVANRANDLVFREAGPKSKKREGKYNFKVTLGIMPDMSGQVRGLRAEMVIPGKPADIAGMEKGDIIVAMDGKPVNDIYDYMNRLMEYHSGQRVNVDIIRNGEKMVLIVVL